MHKICLYTTYMVNRAALQRTQSRVPFTLILDRCLQRHAGLGIFNIFNE